MTLQQESHGVIWVLCHEFLGICDINIISGQIKKLTYKFWPTWYDKES